MKPSNNLENKTPSDIYWGVQLVCKKVQAHCSLEPPLEPSISTRCLWQIKVHYDLFNHLESFSICKFGSIKNSFPTITTLAELYFRFRRFILLVQTKKVISMKYRSSTSSWKPWRWVRLDLILSMRDIYIKSNLNPFTKVTSSSRSTEFKDILPWNISQMITKTVLISTKIVISYAMRRGIPLWIWWKVSENWDKNMIRISQWRESHCRTNTSVRRNK